MRLVCIAVFAALVALTLGCNKPSEADCKKAVSNIRTLTGTTRDDFGVKPQAAIRSCRGNASKASVKCAMKAATLEELEQCEGGMAESLMGDDDKPSDEPSGEPSNDGT